MTLLSHRARFVFLKTHKTASTSVEAALEPLCAPDGARTGDHMRDESVSEAGAIGARGKAVETATWRNHMSARAVRRLTGPRVWRDYAKITTVRNPYDRMVSMFLSRLEPEERERIAGARFDEVRREFARWLRGRWRSNNLNKLTLRRVYCIDHVVYFESLGDDFAELAAALGLPSAELPRFKTDRRLREEPWRDYYDDETRRLVARGSAFELAFFGYDFEGGPNPPGFARRAARLLTRDPARVFSAFRAPAKRIGENAFSP